MLDGQRLRTHRVQQAQGAIGAAVPEVDGRAIRIPQPRQLAVGRMIDIPYCISGAHAVTRIQPLFDGEQRQAVATNTGCPTGQTDVNGGSIVMARLLSQSFCAPLSLAPRHCSEICRGAATQQNHR